MRRFLIPATVVGLVLGIPMLVLQRWVAETRFAAIVLVLAWFAIVGIALAVYLVRHRQVRLPAGGAYVAILVATIAIGYLTGFRDMKVDEDVAMAATRASKEERARGLSGSGGRAPAAGKPVELARGAFEGADGHAGEGTATVVAAPGGERLLTFTEFDVDPGVDVEVYLSTDPEDVSDRVELGGLKGNVGDQQYEIPESADLRRYSNVVLWCTPFTVRIAVAPLAS